MICRALSERVLPIADDLDENPQALEKDFSPPAPSLLSLPGGEQTKEASFFMQGVESAYLSNSINLTFSTPS
jgi:hypothetical protein